ncbi:Leucine Rich Repeat [Cellulophaga tyrosinoxydans]|uniref:Leucine Rich Repeat n=2 Tax=Cellulophaga tyrosinoxydans TaxID=504486 RepID=A0A1W1ZCR5_9FLAO|nr:Leucine Rich Repeat [Cellulophaga tyrosinoxydans]
MNKQTNYFNENFSAMKRNIIGLCLVATFLVSFSSFADVSKSEKQALLELFKQTNGDKWNTSWDLNTSVDTWYGVTVKNNAVVKINLFHNNLSGAIPASIGDLTYLTELNLAFNQLTGELPSEISKLHRLSVLKIEMNRLKGSLPENLGEMVQLQELTAFNNFLSGTIPNSVGELKRLKVLNLSSNNFKGTIPNSIGSLENLETLGLFENSLEGTMPSEFGKLEKLKELVLANNQLNGAIPKEVGQLANLEIFQVQNNGFDSFEDINAIKTSSLLVFDFDKEKIQTSPKYKDIDSFMTRMADTKFEDDNDN